MSDLILSPKHGVNPTIPRCFYCGEEKNELVLLGKLKGDAEAPKNVVLDTVPCDTCAGYMKQGIIVIQATDEDHQDTRNPNRTGLMVVVTEDAIKRIVSDAKILASILEHRVTIMPKRVWEKLGLPTKPTEEKIPRYLQ